MTRGPRDARSAHAARKGSSCQSAHPRPSDDGSRGVGTGLRAWGRCAATLATLLLRHPVAVRRTAERHQLAAHAHSGVVGGHAPKVASHRATHSKSAGRCGMWQPLRVAFPLSGPTSVPRARGVSTGLRPCGRYTVTWAALLRAGSSVSSGRSGWHRMTRSPTRSRVPNGTAAPTRCVRAAREGARPGTRCGHPPLHPALGTS